MDLDQLIREADPARELRIDTPDPRQIRTRAANRRSGRPGASSPRRSFGLSGVLALAGSLLAVAVVVGVVVVVSGRHDDRVAINHPTVGSPKAQSPALGILQRSQTARDRTLPAVIRRADRLGGARKQASDDLAGVIPSTMRYAQTLDDGQEVFLSQARAPHGAQTVLDLFVITPNGGLENGPPVVSASNGLPHRITRNQGPVAAGCTTNGGPDNPIRAITVYAVVSNGVARVSWRFSAQDTGSAPRTISVPVLGNTAVATIYGIGSCNGPSSTTSYDKNGNVITRTLGRNLPQSTGGAPPPIYPKSQHGQTYGSDSRAATPAEEPQLIAATGKTTSGKIISGYVRRWQLNQGSCGNVKTPAAALRCQSHERSRQIPLLARNGTTVLGHFTVAGA